jgi:hypothetical protein
VTRCDGAVSQRSHGSELADGASLHPGKMIRGSAFEIVVFALCLKHLGQLILGLLPPLTLHLGEVDPAALLTRLKTA